MKIKKFFGKLKLFTGKFIRPVLALILAFSCSFSALKATANDAIIYISNVEILEKSDTVIINNLSHDKLSVQSDATFHRLNDHIEYTITLKNSSQNNYVLRSINNTSENDYIDYVCTNCFEPDLEFPASGESKIKFVAKYTNQVQDMSKRPQQDNFELQLVLQEVEEDILVPNTGDNTEIITISNSTAKHAHLYITISIISLVGLIILIITTKKKIKAKTRLIILAFLITTTIPSTVYAASLNVSLAFENKYLLMDRVVVRTYEDGAFKTIKVNYGEEVPVPSEHEERPGYGFDGWYVDGEKVVDKVIADHDFEFEPRYSLIEYTIAYDLDDGTLENDNPTKYTVESDSFTLNNPSKQGYDFIGWTGSNGETPQTTVTINNGSTEDRSYVANYSPREDTPYKVIHRQMNIDGTDYQEVETEEFTGTTGSPVTPGVKSYTGFTSPEPQTVIINGNGRTEIVYDYIRNKYRLTLNHPEYVEQGNISNMYYYDTQITVTAISRTDEEYRFVKWDKNSEEATTEPTYTFTMPNSEVTLEPIYEWVDPYPVAWSYAGPCEFNAYAGDDEKDHGLISGEQCLDYNGLEYIDTGIALYSDENINKDYEIFFTVNHFSADEQLRQLQETIMNAKNTSWLPGVVYRLATDGNNHIRSRINLDKADDAYIPIDDNQRIAIMRLNGNIYYKLNDSAYILLQKDAISDIEGTFDITTWFGAAPDYYNDYAPKRFITGILSSMAIKLGENRDADFYEITFNTNGGSLSHKKYYVQKGDAIGTLPTPSRTNHMFNGWYDTNGQEISSDTVPDSNETYIAHWIKDIEGATILNTDISLVIGESRQIEIADAQNVEPLSFSTEDSSIATVNPETGEITASRIGSTNITITGLHSDKTRNVRVTVYDRRYIVHFVTDGGSAVADMEVFPGQKINQIPSSTKDEYTFLGWFTGENGEGDELTEETEIDGDITYYAFWDDGVTEVTIVCKKAKELHTEQCSRTSGGCFDAGYSNGDDITYGTLPGAGEPELGNAYDCDVNYDNKYNSNTERFYYLGENGSNGVLVSFSNFEGVNGQRNTNIFSYNDIPAQLPSTSQWSNPNLELFDERPARILSKSELENFCNGDTTTGSLDGCQFLVENSRLSSESLGRTGIWLQKESSNYRILTTDRAIRSVNNNSNNTVRPVIEVPLQYIQTGTDIHIRFDYNDGSGEYIERTIGPSEPIIDLPHLDDKENIHFKGWFTASDSGYEITKYTVPTGDVTYYAHWSEEEQPTRTVCKLATGLHQYNSNNIGRIASPGDEFSIGDAYDCDINNDTEYDPETERFYVISHNNDYVSLYYYNFMPDASVQNKFDYNGAIAALPDSSTWENPSLKSFENGKVARLMTYQELPQQCIDSGNSDACKNILGGDYLFLLENTKYMVNSDSYPSGIWLQKNINIYVRIHAANRVIGINVSSSSSNASRPVIEVPVNLVEKPYESSDEIVSHYILSDAMKQYFLNIGTWSSDVTTLTSELKSNYDSHDCKPTNKLDVSPDFELKYNSGDTYCDKSMPYVTGIESELKVYLSDENTKEKGAEVGYTKSLNGSIYNMIPGQTYYFEAKDDSSKHGYVKAVGERRVMDVGSLRNVRDLGGLQADGGTIKYGRLFRGTELANDSNNPDALRDIGVTKEYELRGDATGSDAKMDNWVKKTVIHYNFATDTPNNYAYTRSALSSLMSDIVAGENIYFHCTHGADRTGTIAYLAEGLLGVSEEDRIKDYELTTFSGQADRTRFYDHTSKSSTFDTQKKFVYMQTFVKTNQEIYDWFMAGTTDRAADETLIQNFRAAMIES